MIVSIFEMFLSLKFGGLLNLCDFLMMPSFLGFL